MNDKVNIISNSHCWMESTATGQLQALALLADVERVVGLPDLHAGKTPVGAAVLCRGRVYPHLVGNDIGCGMGLFHTGIPPKKYRQDHFVRRLTEIRALENLPTENPYPEESPIYDLGTLGGGNHFGEFQVLDTVQDAQAVQALGINRQEVLLLVHCGSRGYGQRILGEFPGYEGLTGEEQARYLALHSDACLWARRNRRIVAEKLISAVGFSSEPETVLDRCHNFVEAMPGGLFLHRKGAASATEGVCVIPGSRGSLTYLVRPAQDTERSLWSISHGSGRKWARSLCKGRLWDKYNRDTIRTTALRSRVVCRDSDLLLEEAPEAYKDVGAVVEALTENRLVEVIATLRPLVTYKG